MCAAQFKYTHSLIGGGGEVSNNGTVTSGDSDKFPSNPCIIHKVIALDSLRMTTSGIGWLCKAAG